MVVALGRPYLVVVYGTYGFLEFSDFSESDRARLESMRAFDPATYGDRVSFTARNVALSSSLRG